MARVPLMFEAPHPLRWGGWRISGSTLIPALYYLVLDPSNELTVPTKESFRILLAAKIQISDTCNDSFLKPPLHQAVDRCTATVDMNLREMRHPSLIHLNSFPPPLSILVMS